MTKKDSRFALFSPVVFAALFVTGLLTACDSDSDKRKNEAALNGEENAATIDPANNAAARVEMNHQVTQPLLQAVPADHGRASAVDKAGVPSDSPLLKAANVPPEK